MIDGKIAVVPAGALAAITGGVVSEVSGAGYDFDVTYIRRTPEYEWNAQKNWPDVGEKITFTAHVINKGSITASDVEYEWKLYDLSNNMVAENKGGFPKIVAGEDVTAALDWNWKDGPYKLVFVVDPANKVQELFENNNELEEFTNSYLVAFKVEKTLYDWFNSKESCKDVPDSYFVWADGSVKSGYRCGTKSWEDWAQRQIRQFNEFLMKAEDEHLGKVRHSLPRLKLQRVDVVDDNYMYNRGGVFYHNCPFDYVPERKYYDSSWGFEKTAWAQSGTPESTDFYTKNPEWLVVERGLIHELGHTFNRPHLDVGKLENGQVKIKDKSGNFVFSQQGIVYLCDEKICVDDIMSNPGSSKGFSKYTALGFKYQLGYSDRARKVPVRIGHRNGCEWYGDDYPETLKSELQLPKSNKLKVVGIDGNPVPNVDVSIYLSQPQQDFMPYVDDVPDLKGKTDSNGIFDLGQYPLAPSGTKYPRIGRSFVIKISQGDSDQYRFLDVMHMNLELWKGNSDAIYLADVTALGSHNNIINFGGKSPDAANLALGKKADASINSGLATNANEGDTSNSAKFWEPVNGEGKVGDWWDVDLARLPALYKVVLYSYAGNYHDWYSRFHIDVSNDRKTWVTVAAEADWDKSRSGKQVVSYTFSPQQGRFVRIISDISQNYVKLQEVEVYGLKDSNVPLTCSDGTPESQCSVTKPLYCSNGALINYCSPCGCVSGYDCKPDGTCQKPACSDGTLYSSCSKTKPLYCDKGSLVNSCGVCGCDSGLACNLDGSCQAKEQPKPPETVALPSLNVGGEQPKSSETEVLPSLNVGDIASFTFDKSSDLSISEIAVEAGSSSISPTITVAEALAPAGVPEPIPSSVGVVYKYVSITKQNLDQASNVRIFFTIPNSWFAINSLDPATVSLNHMVSNGWKKLDTTQIDADEVWTYYEAASTGFSTFAITAESVKSTSPPQQPQPAATSTPATPQQNVLKSQLQPQTPQQPHEKTLEGTNSKYWLPWVATGLISLATFGVIVAFIMGKLPFKVGGRGRQQAQAEKHDPRMVRYISAKLDAGFSPASIKTSLVKSGWSENYVEEVIVSVLAAR